MKIFMTKMSINEFTTKDKIMQLNGIIYSLQPSLNSFFFFFIHLHPLKA